MTEHPNTRVPVEPDPSGIRAAIDAGLVSAEPTTVTVGDKLAMLAFTVPAGAQVKTVDVIEALAQHQPAPARKTGRFTTTDAASFVSYFNEQNAGAGEVWANHAQSKIVGVLNAHGETPGWADHRVTWAVQHTPEWKAWATHDGKLMSQSDFAELIEDRLIDIIEPTAADMLELAQTFEANIGVRFESSRVLSSGERQLVYKEDVQASAGRSGQIDIPREFTLVLRPFDGADQVTITARFRYRITNGDLRVGYKLTRPEDVLRDAFDSVVDSVRNGVHDTPVYLGESA